MTRWPHQPQCVNQVGFTNLVFANYYRVVAQANIYMADVAEVPDNNAADPHFQLGHRLIIAPLPTLPKDPTRGGQPWPLRPWTW